MSPGLIEASGLAVSAKNPNVIWSHNDTGDQARLFAMTATGSDLGTYTLQGVAPVDWEDIAIGPGPLPGKSYLYIADTGANGSMRDFVTVYRVEEPRVSAEQKPLLRNLQAVSRFDLVYAGGSTHDSEALMVDPVTADVYLITKPREGSPLVFRASPTLLPGSQKGMLEPVATLSAIGKDWVFPAFVTASDMSRDGRYILVRTYLRAYLWQRAANEPVGAALKRRPCAVPLALEQQGEAIAFSPDSQSYYTTSEGVRPLLQRFQRQ